MRPIVDAMSSRPVVVGVAANAGEARRIAEESGVHHLLVVDANELVGVVCLCDLGDRAPATPLARFVRSPFVFVRIDATAAEAASVMLECRVGCLPVLDETGELRGIVTRRDLRRVGALPGTRGVDLCAGCGDTHSLGTSKRGGDVVFCRDCLDRGRPHHQDTEGATTLGGFD
jgi:CBS-domain-containing membrane protein